MISSFRRLTKSKAGPWVLGLFLILIMTSFALADMSNVMSGNLGATSSSTLVEVGGEEVTDRDMTQAMERRLSQVRLQDPQADYASIAGDFEPLLAALIDMRTLRAFADKNGFVISKRLVDAEIANIPGTRGLDGRVSTQAYAAFLAQQRMSDAELRTILRASLLQRLLLTPVAANARVPVGLASPYASLLLETREAQIATVPIDAFTSGLNPSDAQLQQFHAANRSRYMVPEQRVLRLARMGPEQVANVQASDAEIAAYYRANQATYGSREIRVISQAVVPDQAVAQAIATRARGGAAFAAAAAPAGLSSADISVGPQTRTEFASLAGDRVAQAAFAAAAGAIVGPVQSDLGWHVVKVESVRTEGGKSLEAARAEIAQRLTAEKRKEALTDIVTRVEDAIADGANFAEAAALAKLPVTQTPAITAAGTSRADANYRLPPEFAPALQSGFEMAANDEPVVETLGEEQGYVMVAPAEIIPAAPAPLASIRQTVRADWIRQQASARARAVANAIQAKATQNVPLERAVAEANTSLPGVENIRARRIQLTQPDVQVPAPVRMMFNLAPGKSRLVGDPQGQGYYIVKLTKVTPGNALLQPTLITQVQTEFQETAAEEYASQFLAALRKQLGVRRNEEAIAEAKKRLTGN